MMLQSLSRWVLPCFILTILVYGSFKRVRVYEVFIQGAEDGLHTGIRLFPYLLAIFAALAVFRSSGALTLFLRFLSPLADLFGVPKELIPLAILKPLSGSAALGYMGELIQKYGPDSPIGRLASAVQGSTETTLYVLTVYLGAIGIRHPGHLLAVGLLADAAAFATAVLVITYAF
jgi:spore maturation protein B